jgi:SAM-dependent methyltransferase
MGEEGLIPTTDRYGTALSDIVGCGECGHMQLDQMPSEADLSAAYGDAASNDYVSEEAGQRATAVETLDAIERHAVKGKLLDLGCWVGFLLAEARNRGWEVVGIEPSNFASDYARDELGLDVRTTGLFEAGLPAAGFQAIFMGDVIEHIPDVDRATERVAHLLTSGGIFAMALPDAGSRVARLMGRRWWSVIPTHVHYFTRRSVHALLERHGFRVVEIQTAPKAFSVRYYLERLGGYDTRFSRGLVKSAETVRLANRIWAPDFRDRMLVVARLDESPPG